MTEENTKPPVWLVEAIKLLEINVFGLGFSKDLDPRSIEVWLRSFSEVAEALEKEKAASVLEYDETLAKVSAVITALKAKRQQDD